ncbi:transcription factor TCP12-like [Durio zibethinus]|uniref:Transcription factor TCP12-like n=1 Tax=Durio zibethinus TaxID=66656 RepID=A0A6P6BFD4_DURZI|nr:transcription factor TCP12-like [Durio zibethinus]
MFPSSNTYDPFPLTTHTMPGSSFSGDKQAAGSLLEDPPPPFWHFSAPFIDDDADGLLMSHLLSPGQQQILGSSSNMAPPDSEINAASPIKETKKVTTNRKRSANNAAKQGIPRKRTGKKDRHSKIYTAHGPRDRRMRLSLQIARKFFDLQDMLGFDKASKTIEWLFSKSKAAIKELTENLPGVKHSCSGGGKSVSSTSESEVVSAAKECEDNMGDQQVVIARGESMSAAAARETKERKSRKVSFNPVARESRDMARARARERTREKMKMRGLEKSITSSDEPNPNELGRLQSSSPLEAGENSGPSTQPNFCCKVVAEEEEQHHQNTLHSLEHQMDSVSIIEKFLGITRSSSMFNYSHSVADSEENCPVFPGYWGMNNERIQYSYCSMTNINESTGNAQEQNPSVIFMTDPNGQEQKSSPIFLTQGENPSSNPMVNSYAKIMNHNSDSMNPSNAHEGISPTSILMSTSDIGLHSHYQENPAVASKNRIFY